MTTPAIQGSIVALVTPMSDDGAIDYPALEALVDWHVSEGTSAIVSVGTTGESATLDMDEHIEVIRRTVKAAAGRIPVIAGTGANSTSEAIELTQGAKSAGAQACLLVTPYYNKPPQEGLYRHYLALAEAVEIPQILYNVPGRTGCDLLPATVARLMSVPNIVGLKEAVGDPERVAALLALRRPPHFALYSGDDATARTSILAGFQGDISVTANVAPGAMARMCAAALAGDAAAAEAADVPLAGLHERLFLDPNPIPVKWALARMGRIGNGIRLPLVSMNPKYEKPLTEALQQAGAL
jgi:4-hydroxy-tetrahydrodipicolinate synthase